MAIFLVNKRFWAVLHKYLATKITKLNFSSLQNFNFENFAEFIYILLST